MNSVWLPSSKGREGERLPALPLAGREIVAEREIAVALSMIL